MRLAYVIAVGIGLALTSALDVQQAEAFPVDSLSAESASPGLVQDVQYYAGGRYGNPYRRAENNMIRRHNRIARQRQYMRREYRYCGYRRYC